LARFNMSTIGVRLFAVTVWRDGRQDAIAILPASAKMEQWAREFCAAQNQQNDAAAEREFIRRAARYGAVRLRDWTAAAILEDHIERRWGVRPEIIKQGEQWIRQPKNS